MGRKPGSLPNNSRLRLVAITERSAPDPKRPRMEDDVERRLLRIEAESAACYADIEDAAARFTAFAEYLDEVEGVPEEIEHEQSVVQHISELSVHLQAGNGKLGQ